MRKILLIFVVCIANLMVTTMRAQCFIISPEIGYERVGLNISGNQNQELRLHAGNGLRFGAAAAYKFKNRVFLQSGLYYSHRGGAHLLGIENDSRLPFVKDIRLKTMDFLTLPLTVGYEIAIDGRWGIGLEAGGYMASGVGLGSSFFGCINGEGSAGSIFKDSHFTVASQHGSNRENVTINGSDRMDTGWMVGANVRFDKFKLKATYQFGLLKTIYDMATPRTFTVSLAYDFEL